MLLRALCSLWLTALLIGCSNSALTRDQLSASPIAVLYWNSEQARQLAELEGEGPSEPTTREGVASVESLGRLLGAREGGGRRGHPGRLCFVDPTSLKITRIDAAPLGSRPLAWSADRRRLLFSNEQGGKYSQLFEYDLDSGEVRRLTSGARYHSEGTFGPEDRVAFFAWSRTAGGYSAEVFATGPGGAQPRAVLKGEVVEDLAWATDPSTLIYSRTSGKQRRGSDPPSHIISRIFTASGELAAAGQTLARGRGPALTPDGEWIVYSAPITTGGWRLRRMRIDGSSKTALGRPSRRDENDPTVSPDGQFVAYVGDDNGIDRLFVRRFDGSGDRILLTDGMIASPVW